MEALSKGLDGAARARGRDGFRFRPERCRRDLVVLVVAVLVATMLGSGVATAGTVPAGASGEVDFGANVTIFDPSMSTSQITAAVEAIAAQQVGNQFGQERYALLFQPGTYGTAA